MFGSERVVAWRVLDAQYFGVAQRRRRVFVVACPRDGADPTKILFEPESLCRNSPPSRSERKETTGNVGNFLASGRDVTGTILANSGDKQWLGNQEAFTGDFHVICIAGNIIDRQPQHGGNGCGTSEEISYTLTTADRHAVCVQYKVRRLLPIECERLQGFPDNYTNIPGSSDSVRYKALGNSMAVPVMKWLGERILNEY